MSPLSLPPPTSPSFLQGKVYLLLKDYENAINCIRSAVKPCCIFYKYCTCNIVHVILYMCILCCVLIEWLVSWILVLVGLMHRKLLSTLFLGIMRKYICTPYYIITSTPPLPLFYVKAVSMLRGNLRGSQITYLHTVLGKVYLRGGKLKEAAESFKEAQKYLVIQFYYYY